MKSDSLKASVIWKFFERASVQVISLVVQIILARLISPDQFGSLSIILVFYNLFDIFVQKGFGSALIRKKELSKSDIDTTLVSSIIISIVTFAFIYFIAPLVGKLYNTPELIWPLRVMALSLLISPFFCIFNSLLIRNMQFKVIFIRGLLASVMSGALGIYMAYDGYGLWALVAQIVSNQAILTIVMAFGVDYKCGFHFSRASFQEVFNFGKNVLATETLLYLVESARTMCIGKSYSTTQLAYYDRGQTYPNVMMNAINDTFFSTFLPFFSKNQSNNEILKEKYISLTKIAILITTPLFLGFAAVSPEFTYTILTSKWNDAVPFIIVFCIYQTIFPYQTICKVVLYAKGDSKNVLKIEIWKSALSLFLMIIALLFGPIYVALSLIVVRAFSVWMYMFYLKKHLGAVGIVRQTYRPFISSSLMFFVVYNLSFFEDNSIVGLIIKIIIGVLAYFFFEYIFDRKYINYILQTTISKIKK